MTNQNNAKKKKKIAPAFLFFLLTVPIIVCVCMWELSQALSPVDELDTREQIIGLPSRGVLPSGGTCENVGRDFGEETPFHGWPLGEWHRCDWRIISSYFCSPNYFGGRYVHWGMDFASYWSQTSGESSESIFDRPVVATGHAQVVQAVWSDPPGHNYGMGNFVQIQAIAPLCESETGADLDGDGRIEPGNCIYTCESEVGFDLDGDGEVGAFCGDLLPWKASYFHLHTVEVDVGQRVEPGSVLGRVDNTGNSTGNHLHYQINNLDGDVGAIDPGPTLGCGNYDWAAGVEVGR